MHRRRSLTGVGLAAAASAFALVACGGGVPHGAAGSPAATSRASSSLGLPRTSPSSAAPSAPATTAPACTNAARLAGWPNRRLALLTIAVPASESTPSEVEAEVSAGAGGVVLFGSAAPSDLGARLADLRSHVPGRLGLLVMTDEEGGGVQRMANLVGSLPWPAWMGAHWTGDQIRRAVAGVGARMAAAGVNMDLAPVADVDGREVQPSAADPDGLRSFSGSPDVVSRDTVAYLDGLRSAGVIPVVKHFPGLGGASGNTDNGPAHTPPWATVQATGLPPFAAAFAAGAPAVMVSHATIPGLSTAPAGLSATVTDDVLKGRMGFHGLVLTDSLSAGAISGAGYTVPGAAVQALRSGADMVMFGPLKDVAGETSAIASAVTAAVDHGQLPRARLIDAADQILAVRHVNLCGA